MGLSGMDCRLTEPEPLPEESSIYRTGSYGQAQLPEKFCHIIIAALNFSGALIRQAPQHQESSRWTVSVQW